MKCVDLVRLLPGLLMFGLSLSNARADGGVIRLREAKGPFLVTIFTAAEPVQDGLGDVSVLVQRRDSGDAILDATVELVFKAPAASGRASRLGSCVARPGAGCWVEAQNQVRHNQLSRPTRRLASNKLLYAAPIRFGTAGNWTLDAIVTRGSDSARASCVMAVGPPAGRLIGLLPYLLLPPLIVILFAINQRLRKELWFA